MLSTFFYIFARHVRTLASKCRSPIRGENLGTVSLLKIVSSLLSMELGCGGISEGLVLVVMFGGGGGGEES